MINPKGGLILVKQGGLGCYNTLREDAAEDLAGKGKQCEISSSVAVSQVFFVLQLHAYSFL